MNGIHDIGGMDNIGNVSREEDEPVFHAEWERRVFANAIALLGAGCFKLDEVRRAVEWMPPKDYLAASYYETWLFGLMRLLVEKGFATEEELQIGRSRTERASQSPPPLTPQVAHLIMKSPVPTQVDIEAMPLFCQGDRVTARNINPRHHTRLPRYARGKHGVIEGCHGAFLLPDANAHGGQPHAEYSYSVAFSANELWGDTARADDLVSLDLFETYLEPEQC